jgi:tripartite-type tricarboxylate transporter receptor subunit TctC
MCIRRRGLGLALLSVLLLPWFAYAQPQSQAQTQNYPTKPIRLVVGFAGGGAAEIAARIVGQVYTERWGQQVIIDPRPGAGGNIASELVAKAPPDGYTLLVCAFAFTVNPSLFSKLPFDTQKDFAPVSLFAYTANFLAVHPSVPARSIKEFIALAKARPEQITFGSAGNGTASHLAGELMNSMAGIRLLHIPYKGSSPAHTDLLGGHISSAFPGVAISLPHIRAGRLRALGVTGLKRAESLPEVPTISESGLQGFEVISWYGLLAPAATPADIVQRLNGELNRALKEPGSAERVKALGMDTWQTTPAEFDSFIHRELAKWGKVIKAVGVRAN